MLLLALLLPLFMLCESTAYKPKFVAVVYHHGARAPLEGPPRKQLKKREKKKQVVLTLFYALQPSGRALNGCGRWLRVSWCGRGCDQTLSLGSSSRASILTVG